MTVVSVYTINDYLETPVVINIDPAISNRNSTFPAVSVCIQKGYARFCLKKIEQFIKKYYADHNIKEPERYVDLLLLDL